MLALEARIFVSADVIPRPTVKAVFLDVGDVVRRKIVADVVAFVYRGPELAFSIDGDAHRIANSGRIDPQIAAVRACDKDIRAMEFAFVFVGVGYIRARSHGNEHLLAIERECNITRPVSAAAHRLLSARQAGNYGFSRTSGFEVAIPIRKSNDRVGVAKINVLGLRPGRIERDSERPAKTLRKCFDFLRLSLARQAAKHQDTAWIAFREKKVAVRGGSDQARVIEFAGEQIDLESRWRLRPRVPRTADDIRIIFDGGRCIRLRQIAWDDFVDFAWL